MRLQTIFTLTLLLAACGGGGSGSNSPSGGGGSMAITFGVDQAFQPPALSGGHRIGTKAFHWEDLLREELITSAPGDNRELMVHLFYPTDSTTGDFRTPVVRAQHWATLSTEEVMSGRALRRSNYDGVFWPFEHEPAISAAEASYPVIIFSHGGGGAIERNLFLIGEFASRGFVVAAINHTYFTDFVSFPDGRLITGRGFGLDGDPTITPAEEALLAEAQDLWSDDQIFVLEQLISLDQDPVDGFLGRLDMNRVVAGGFSFGGATAYEAASKDPRIRAVVEGDGTIWQPAGLNIAVPLLFVQSGAGAQLSIFSQINADGYAVLFDGGIAHLGIEDLSLWWRWDFPALNPFGPRGGEDALRTIGLVSGEFLGKYLDGDPAPSLDDPLQTPVGVRITTF
jgi:dienelactone hydrolase